jgi:hypothetical protein
MMESQMPIKAASSTSTSARPLALFEELVDIVEDRGHPMFLVKKDDQLVVQPDIERDGVLYVPPIPEQIPWLLPRAEEVKRWYREDTGAALYDALATVYHPSISKLPTEAHYDLLTAFDLHTYLLEHFHYSPILVFDGPAEYGKTRTGKGCIHIAYRGFHTESLNEAYIFRLADRFRATLFFDVMDVWEKSTKRQSVDILLKRFEKGASVPRVNPDKDPYDDVQYYNIFGATIIATNETVHLTLDSRALTIYMPYSEGRFTEPTPELALSYKERSVAFRARHLGQSLPELDKPFPGRLGDIALPLLQILQAARPERRVALLRLIAEQQQARQDRAGLSHEAKVVRAVLEVSQNRQNDRLAVKAITVTYNAVNGSSMNEKSMGWQLKKLGFQRGETSDGCAAIWWDEPYTTTLARKYALRTTPDTPETPETP